MTRNSYRPQFNSSSREIGKTGMQQHNKDRMGSNSGPMGSEDQRKDKYGSTHNQDVHGLQSDETTKVRKELGAMRQKARHRHRRLGSRK